MSEVIKFWDSIYQNARYIDVLDKFGVKVETRQDDSGNQVHFIESGPEMIAWEVGNGVNERTVQGLEPHHRMFVYAGEEDVDNIDWALGVDDYYTLVIRPGWEGPSRRFNRSLRKAEKNGLEHAQAETDKQIRRALARFRSQPTHRGNMEQSDFVDLSTRLLANDLADIHVVFEPLGARERNLVGTSVVLRSDTQVNMRYYTAERAHNAGHALHHGVISHYLSNPRIGVIDQSGYTHPYHLDDQMRGINEFKLQVSRDVARFK